MPLRRFAQICAITGAVALAAMQAAPALAHGKEHHEPGIAPGGPDNRPVWKESGPAHYDAGHYGMDSRAREDWLAECRRRASDNGVGGAVIGGLAGGVIGNRIAGKGDRAIGTVAGAAIGAVAGAVIDKEEDRGRVRDDCEAYLDTYSAGPYPAGPAYGGHPGYGYGYPAAYGYYGYGVPMVMVPVMVPVKTNCVETVVTEEYVAAPARRHIRRPVRDKRVRIAPDKRIRIK